VVFVRREPRRDRHLLQPAVALRDHGSPLLLRPEADQTLVDAVHAEYRSGDYLPGGDAAGIRERVDQPRHSRPLGGDVSAAKVTAVTGWTGGPTFSGDSLLIRYVISSSLRIRLFAYRSHGWASSRSYVHPVTCVWSALVIVAFTDARFVAMGFNRIADRALDAEKP